jgi:hypothetical protein
LLHCHLGHISFSPTQTDQPDRADHPGQDQHKTHDEQQPTLLSETRADLTLNKLEPLLLKRDRNGDKIIAALHDKTSCS